MTSARSAAASAPAAAARLTVAILDFQANTPATPDLGQHTNAVLKGLGFSPKKIKELRAGGAI